MPEPMYPMYTSFAKGELSPSMYGRIDVQYYTIGTRVMQNFGVHPQGGVSNLPGTQFIASVKNAADPVALIDFEFSTTQAYVLEFGDYYMRVIKDKALVMDGAVPYELVTPYSKSDVKKIRYTQSADVLFLTCPGFPPKEVSRLGDASWTITDFAFENGPFLDENTDESTLTLSAVSGSTGLYGEYVTVTASESMFTADDVGRWIRIRYIRPSKLIKSGSYDPPGTGTLSLGEVDGKVVFNYRYGGTGGGSVERALECSFDGGTSWQQLHSLNNTEAMTEVTEELRSKDYNYVIPMLRYTQNGDTDILYYSLRLLSEEAYGYLKITGYISSTIVTCQVKQSVEYLGIPTTLWALGAWGKNSGYPETVMFYQDRLVFAHTKTRCNSVELSKTGDYTNFDRT